MLNDSHIYIHLFVGCYEGVGMSIHIDQGIASYSNIDINFFSRKKNYFHTKSTMLHKSKRFIDFMYSGHTFGHNINISSMGH